MIIKYNKVFIVRFDIGKVKIVKGKFSSSDYNNFKQLVRKSPSKGYAFGLIDSNNLKINFSSSLSSSFQQRFRNIFPYFNFPQSSINTPNSPLQNRI